MASEMRKILEKMTPEQRKKAVAAMSDMMGMPPKKKRTAKTSATAKKSTKK